MLALSCITITSGQDLQPFELEELLSGAFKLRSQNATWLAGMPARLINNNVLNAHKQ